MQSSSTIMVSFSASGCDFKMQQQNKPILSFLHIVVLVDL